MRAVGHLDPDCFYVSAERVRDEFLNGKPVGVLGNRARLLNEGEAFDHNLDALLGI
jgi:nucleotidyltransferase/DNA polymerase involved in DNA repair